MSRTAVVRVYSGALCNFNRVWGDSMRKLLVIIHASTEEVQVLRSLVEDRGEGSKGMGL